MTLLADRRYAELAALCGGGRMNAHDLEVAVGSYGRTVVPLPTQALSLVDYVQINGAHPPAWPVQAPVFTVEEGRSDLTLELILVEQSDGGFRVELDDLHVL